MKILHVAETLRGGIASYLDEILPAQLMRYGHGEVGILAGEDQVTELKPLRGLCVYTYDANAGRLQRTHSLARALRGLVAETDCDLVHAHSTFAGVAARVVLGPLRRRPKLVYCAHGWAFDRAAPWLQLQAARALELMLSPFTDRIVCISAHDLRSAHAAGLPGARLTLLTNGIAVDSHAECSDAAWPDGAIRVLFVGRFDRQKGADIFAATMTELGNGWHGCAIGAPVVDGASPDFPRNFPPNVSCVGWLRRDDVQRYLASCDVLVVPSRWEGFGLIAVEAMRAGKAVVAARVGGLADIVVDGITGRLVEPHDASGFIEALRTLDRDDLRAMGVAGRTRFLREYTAESLNRGLFALYDTLLQPRLA